MHLVLSSKIGRLIVGFWCYTGPVSLGHNLLNIRTTSVHQFLNKNYPKAHFLAHNAKHFLMWMNLLTWAFSANPISSACIILLFSYLPFLFFCYGKTTCQITKERTSGKIYVCLFFEKINRFCLAQLQLFPLDLDLSLHTWLNSDLFTAYLQIAYLMSLCLCLSLSSFCCSVSSTCMKRVCWS